MSEPTFLLGDIGGTNARFALAGGRDGYYGERVLQCADHPCAEAAMQDYLQAVGAGMPDVICVAAAGPIVDRQCRFTNNSWVISERALSERFGVERVALINDFAAVAFGLPALGEGHCQTIGDVPLAALDGRDFTVAVLGPGTGLGVAGLLGRGTSRIPLVTEGGHVGLAPETSLQRQILERLSGRFDRVSVERVLSGEGLKNLYIALGEVRGETDAALTAAEIFATSQADDASLARQTTDLFFELLGQVGGDLVLTMGATDGVFIAGGIAQRYPQMLAQSGFRAGFERKGRHRDLLAGVPTVLITHPHPGLFGAAECARRLFSS